MQTGKVYIVGAGPGDAELITVKGLRCIREADVILYDRLINKELLTYAKADAELIYCGKAPDCHTVKQETIHSLLIDYARKGCVVTRLKGGDPFIFGRGGEEALALAEHGVDFEIVPGVTAGIGAAAYAGIPLTHRQYGSSFAVITGHRCAQRGQNVNWEQLAQGVDTLVIYMGMSDLDYICEQLMRHGRDPATPAALIHWGTTSRQLTVTGTLRDIAGKAAEHGLTNPTLIVVGEVVKLREKIQWVRENPEHSPYSFAL
jgi:uroporphyrin-III C-methyltransferase